MNGKRSWRLSVWRLRHTMHGAEWHHLTVIGFLSFWALVTATINYPLYVETRQLTSQFSTYSVPNMKDPGPTAHERNTRDIAKEFVASLPVSESYPVQLRALAQLADKTAVVVTRVDYRYEDIPALSVRKLTLHLELRGGEAQQRRLLQTALNTFPNLSVVRLSYTKGTDPGSNVEEKLDINLYYRREKAPA